jgi:hypothetical protein
VLVAGGTYIFVLMVMRCILEWRGLLFTIIAGTQELTVSRVPTTFLKTILGAKGTLVKR